MMTEEAAAEAAAVAAAARALDLEPTATHRGAAVSNVAVVADELFLLVLSAFSATEDSEFPRIATLLRSSRFQ